ncbi:unnamed protein product [Ceratitis capitata]|uniref:(Mediterranean fruit fly) hypothetical protein n=1 Tax=Ceratitis capitata TaxID=7213 RepID=A0A811U9W6_CERCA|nr:unnamed protein product [Ceratitis capitata]
MCASSNSLYVNYALVSITKVTVAATGGRKGGNWQFHTLPSIYNVFKDVPALCVSLLLSDFDCVRVYMYVTITCCPIIFR